ncbi:tRNA lysidine(34) synthetase TilS [Sphingomonas sp. GlSt437]|uniref:tRNA lysidine(34) synthetase TilS n=1 Tax=Sphingomonas sp. GlSt437 TaxID=3389970 RepID=UPI003A8BD96D
MATAPDPGLVARFAADLAAALGRDVAPDEQVALAVSGGPDSMAMLFLAHAALPGQVMAATVDHQLRAGSGDEAAMVARYCDELDVRHATLTPDAPIAGASLQARAREARYAALEHWAAKSSAKILLTAHHADDQAETFLMRAARGSGLAGLAGIRSQQAMGRILVVRPLLGWRRSELRTLATSLALPFVDDPSNVDSRHDRARFRALLATTPELDITGLAASAAYAAEADATLGEMTDLLMEERRQPSEDGTLAADIGTLPRELQRRLTRAAISAVRLICGITRPDFSPATNIEPLLDALAAGTAATQAGILVTPKGTIWRFAEAPPRRSA